MKIGLIDIDYNGSFPNIPLMKLSAWHKAQGDDVDWYDIFKGHFDIVYVSKVFSWSPDYGYPINADKIITGGSGYMIRTIDGKEGFYPLRAHRDCENKGFEFMRELPYEIEHIYPDYSLYPKLTRDTAYGFLTRGCPRGCCFCHVVTKEGKKSVKVANLSEFWHGQKNIVLCDPNILACKDWKPLLQQLIDSKAWIDLNQGVDARMMTEEKARMLGELKMKTIHFAWDRYEDKESVLRGLETYAKYADKKPSDHNSTVYTIVNFDTTPEQDLDRIYTLRELGYWAYVMVYDKANTRDQFYKDLQRWVNNRPIFAICKTLEEYIKNKHQF